MRSNLRNIAVWYAGGMGRFAAKMGSDRSSRVF